MRFRNDAQRKAVMAKLKGYLRKGYFQGLSYDNKSQALQASKSLKSEIEEQGYNYSKYILMTPLPNRKKYYTLYYKFKR